MRRIICSGLEKTHNPEAFSLRLTPQGVLRKAHVLEGPSRDFPLGEKQTDQVPPASSPTPEARQVLLETFRGYWYQGSHEQTITVFDQLGQPVEASLGQLQAANCLMGSRLPLRLGGLRGAPQEVVLPPLPEAHWTSDYGTHVPRRMTAELAEFLGYFMGDGSLHSKGIRLCVAQSDGDVVEYLCRLGRELFGLQAMITSKTGYVEVAFNSIRLVLWWEACGFAKTAPHTSHRGKGYSPLIPAAVVYADDPVIYTAFIRGLFEADGTVSNHYVSWTTTTLAFSRDIQTLLLALGFVTTRKFEKPTRTSWAVNTRYVLRLLNVSAIGRFVQQIGFISRRKNTLTPLPPHAQAARYDHIPLSRAEVDRLAPANDRMRKVLLMSLSRSHTMTRRIGEELLQRTGDEILRERLGFYYDEVVAVNRCSAAAGPSQRAQREMVSAQIRDTGEQ